MAEPTYTEEQLQQFLLSLRPAMQSAGFSDNDFARVRDELQTGSDTMSKQTDTDQSNKRFICTPKTPWKREYGFPVSHTNCHEVGEQESGWPCGDTVRMRCDDCGATWKEELPQ